MKNFNQNCLNSVKEFNLEKCYGILKSAHLPASHLIHERKLQVKIQKKWGLTTLASETCLFKKYCKNLSVSMGLRSIKVLRCLKFFKYTDNINKNRGEKWDFLILEMCLQKKKHNINKT